jgi:hypothetical protein
VADRLEYDNYTLYWDRALSTDSTVPCNRADVTLVDTTNNEAALTQHLQSAGHNYRKTKQISGIGV